MCDVINYLTRVRSSFSGTSRSGLAVTTRFIILALVLLVSLQSSTWAAQKPHGRATQKSSASIQKRNVSSPVQVGIASWHAPKLQSSASRTASQHRWVSSEFVAAHRTLPLGALISVINLENNKRVVVKVIDRGPYIRGRVVDLSMAAARELGMVSRGLAHVRVERISSTSSFKKS